MRIYMYIHFCFIISNVPISIYQIFQSAENESGHQRIEGYDREALIMANKRIRHIKKTFKSRDVLTIRQAARKFDCSKFYIHKTLS